MGEVLRIKPLCPFSGQVLGPTGGPRSLLEPTVNIKVAKKRQPVHLERPTSSSLQRHFDHRTDGPAALRAPGDIIWSTASGHKSAPLRAHYLRCLTFIRDSYPLTHTPCMGRCHTDIKKLCSM